MLLNLHKKSWMEGLTLQDYSEHCKHNESVVKEMLELAKNYNKVKTYFQRLFLITFRICAVRYQALYKQLKAEWPIS